MMACAVVACALMGCGGDEDQATLQDGHYEGDGHDHAGHTHQAAAAEIPIADAKDPTAAAYQFLEAVRLGQQEIAASLFTEKARTATQRPDMFFAPSGSATAQFRLGQPEMTAAGRAAIPCQWTESDIAGQTKTDDFTLLIRENAGQWRITGMSVKLFDDRPNYVLNFENPDELLQQRQAIDDEARRRLEIENTTQEVDAPQQRTSQDPFQSGVQR